MKWVNKVGVALTFCLVPLSMPLAADAVPSRIEAARAAYAKNDLPLTARELEAALAEVHNRLGRALAETLPPIPTGWQSEAPEIQGLGQVGGGLSVSRGYVRGETSLNASLLLDSPAVEAVVAMMTGSGTAPQANFRRVKINGEDALLRYDSSTKTGEISMVLGSRVLLEIEGDNIASADLLIDTAKGWMLSKIKSLSGL